MQERERTTGIGSVYAFTFVNSLGTGVITGALFFLANASYGFSAAQNFLLGVVQGITYIAAAWSSGRVVNGLVRRGVSHRAVLVTVMLLLAAMCGVPLLAKMTAAEGEKPAAWPIWFLAAAYMPLTGVLWPLTEAYLSGGRSGGVLRRALAVWNVVWSSAIPVTYVVMAPFIKERAGGVTWAAEGIAAMGGAHVLAVVILAWFAPAPAPHVHEEHEPHPEVFERLLVSFRWLLPTSYVVQSALTAYLPEVMNTVGIAKEHRTIAATAWLLPRVAMFAVFGFWGKWHGRWWPTVAGAASLIAGFALCVSAPMVAGGTARVLLFTGLPLFGVGMGIIYSGAIYYALEVGKAEVDAGGTHEALIGVGYLLGPGCGLMAALAVERGLMSASAFNPVFMAVVGVVALGACGVVVKRAVGR